MILFRPKMVLRRKCWSPTAGCTPLGTFPGNTKVLAQVVTRWDTFTYLEEQKEVLSFQDMDTTTIVYNSYYQWVPLYLIFLALLFYLPR